MFQAFWCSLPSVRYTWSPDEVPCWIQCAMAGTGDSWNPTNDPSMQGDPEGEGRIVVGGSNETISGAAALYFKLDRI